MLPLLIPAAALVSAALGTSSGRKALGLSDLWGEEKNLPEKRIPDRVRSEQLPEALDTEVANTPWWLEKLGKRLAFLREEKAFSASEVATKAGISRTAVKNLEEGADMKLSTLFSVSSALGVPVVALLDGLQPELNEQMREILQTSQSVVEKEKAELEASEPQNNLLSSKAGDTWIEMETEDGKRVRLRVAK